MNTKHSYTVLAALIVFFGVGFFAGTLVNKPPEVDTRIQTFEWSSEDIVGGDYIDGSTIDNGPTTTGDVLTTPECMTTDCNTDNSVDSHTYYRDTPENSP